MASCYSAPNWSGMEKETGEFIWQQSPGLRFYIHLLILGPVLILFGFGLLGSIFGKSKEPKEKNDIESLGCLVLIFLLLGLVLFRNIEQNVWTESLLINSERVEKQFKGENSFLLWKNITSCQYISGQFDVAKKKMVVGGDRWETGVSKRGITLIDRNKKEMTILVEKDFYDTSLMGIVWEWIFGSSDLIFMPADEARFRKAINKYLPEEVKQKMSPETKEYLGKQE
jgi:hypothetical protein